MANSIGIALSGGGFRAAAFHLGVLKRLHELGILHQASRISTVSGGSITGGLYAVRCCQKGDGSPGSYPIDALIEEMKPLLTIGFRRKALTADWKSSLRTAASYVGIGKRVHRVSAALDKTLFDGAMLCDLPPWLIINATNVLTGKAWRFYHDRAGDFLIGATDKTESILLADAVTASAAFPLFVEPLPFQTRWQDLRGDLLDERWQKPPQDGTGFYSRWRSDFGESSGAVNVPLADGGLYDNEGIEGLRSARVSHLIFSSTAPPDSAPTSTGKVRTYKRLIDIMHSRLGMLTRKLAHETTHGTHPNTARIRLLEIANELANDGKNEIAEELRQLSAVGWPPRGPQFEAYAPIIMNKQDLAKDVYASFDPPIHIAPENRGLNPRLVDALSRTRTDLDSFEPYLINLLISQAYFLTDAHIRLSMPELRKDENVPFCDWATERIREANANEASTLKKLEREAAVQMIHGRTSS